MAIRFSGASIGKEENGHEKNYKKNLHGYPPMDPGLVRPVEFMGLDQVESTSSQGPGNMERRI